MPAEPRSDTPAVRPAWLHWLARLSDACGAAAALMILVSVLITCQMIWVRSVLGGSTVWQTELVIYLMIGATLLGLPWVQRVRGHVNVDLLPRLLPRAARRALSAVVLIATIVIMSVMLFYAGELWLIAFERGWKSDTVWGPPLWIPYLAMPLGFGLYIVQLIVDLVAMWKGYDEPFTIEAATAVEPRGQA